MAAGLFCNITLYYKIDASHFKTAPHASVGGSEIGASRLCVSPPLPTLCSGVPAPASHIRIVSGMATRACSAGLCSRVGSVHYELDGEWANAGGRVFQPSAFEH